MFLLYYTPCGLRGHCTMNTVHDNGEYPLLLQGGFSTVGTHADVVLYPLKFEGVLYNEHSAWQWRIPPYLALPRFGQVSLVRLGIINMLPGNTKWGGILRFFTRRSRAFYPLESKCRRAIQNEGEFSGFLQGDHWHFTPCNPRKRQKLRGPAVSSGQQGVFSTITKNLPLEIKVYDPVLWPHHCKKGCYGCLHRWARSKMVGGHEKKS